MQIVLMVSSVLYASSLSILQTDMAVVSNHVYQMTEVGRLLRGGRLDDA